MADNAQRIAQLKSALAARTKNDGSPQKGYTKNVAALKAELARLTAPAKLA